MGHHRRSDCRAVAGNDAVNCSRVIFTVNPISPGVIGTGAQYRSLRDAIPLGRQAVPDDGVGAALLPASREGSCIVGQSIEINGGVHMP